MTAEQMRQQLARTKLPPASTSLFQSMTAEQLRDLEVRISTGKLTREEEQALIGVAAALGQTVGSVMETFKQSLQGMVPAIQQVGEAMKALGGKLQAPNTPKDRARTNLATNKPLDRWSTDELMAFLPEKAKDSDDLTKLSDLQLACLVQHILNNCSQKDAISYDGALQLKHAPELVKRLVGLDSKRRRERKVEAAVRMKAAWALYRAGDATLEEITPILDQAGELLDSPEPDTVKP
jgi:hypothetical protein